MGWAGLSYFSHVRLCNPMDCSSPGSSVHGILQAEYCSELPCPPPGDHPNPGIEPTSLTSPVLQEGSLLLTPPAAAAAAAAKSLRLYSTLCDPVDSSPPGSPVPGILQARTLEWVAISFSNAWKWRVKVKSLSLGRVLETPWTAAYQAPPFMRFSRQEYWSGVPLPSPTPPELLCYSFSNWSEKCDRPVVGWEKPYRL